jgi:hypothetical protein
VRLEDILSKGGDQLTLVVAHSHGGNVALNAIPKLNDPTNVYLCTLATPFLSIFEADRLRRHSGSLFYIVGALITWNILHGLSVYSLLDSIIPVPFGALLLWWWLFVKGIKSIYTILEALLVNPAPPPGRSPTRWQKWPKLVADATTKNAKALNGRLLVLRGIDDEAALTLAAGAIINRISRAIYNVSAFSLFGWGGWAVFLPILIATKGLEYLAPAYSEAFVRLTLSPLWISAFLALILPSIARTVFGLELAVGAARCDVLFESVPDIDEVEVMTVRANVQSHGLAHSLHGLPEVPNSIAAWLRDCS